MCLEKWAEVRLNLIRREELQDNIKIMKKKIKDYNKRIKRYEEFPPNDTDINVDSMLKFLKEEKEREELYLKQDETELKALEGRC